MVNEEETNVFEIDYPMAWAIQATWESIAADAYEMCEGDNYIAMEFTLDADRLVMNGYNDVEDQLQKLYKEHGYEAVWEYLSENIQLL